ncbi:MAG: sigma-54-dependent Fis family transcriptional regulator [Candidatus Binatia bacterium]
MSDGSLGYSASFEQLLGGISSRLLAATADALDAELEKTVEQLVRFFGADRGALIELGSDGAVRIGCAFAREGMEPIPIGPMDFLPALADAIRRGEGLVMRSLADAPAEWTVEQEYARRTDVRSFLLFPLRVEAAPIGAVGIDSLTTETDWSDELLQRFKLCGEILASTIVRCRSESGLRASLAEISRLKERLEAENVLLHEEILGGAGFDEIVGRSAALRKVLERVEQVASAPSTVLLLGETGTGKELFAHAIHKRSPRSERMLVSVNCAALPGTLIESELFGYEKGAFTGALQRRLGRFEVADGGTILLDEIGDLPLDLQGRLLRVLQDGTFERLGSSKTIKVDVRVIAATNRNLEAAVEDGRLRSDLYYRLRIFPIELPPLRQRCDDIPLLVWYFVTNKQAGFGKQITRIPERAMEALTRYSWPGNVRELENVIERALILSHGDTLAIDEAFTNDGRSPSAAAPGSTLEAVERAHILKTLEDCHWQVAGAGQAAERLGMNRSTLRSRMQKLGIAKA